MILSLKPKAEILDNLDRSGSNEDSNVNAKMMNYPGVITGSNPVMVSGLHNL